MQCPRFFNQNQRAPSRVSNLMDLWQATQITRAPVNDSTYSSFCSVLMRFASHWRFPFCTLCVGVVGEAADSVVSGAGVDWPGKLWGLSCRGKFEVGSDSANQGVSNGRNWLGKEVCGGWIGGLNHCGRSNVSIGVGTVGNWPYPA